MAGRFRPPQTSDPAPPAPPPLRPSSSAASALRKPLVIAICLTIAFYIALQWRLGGLARPPPPHALPPLPAAAAPSAASSAGAAAGASTAASGAAANPQLAPNTDAVPFWSTLLPAPKAGAVNLHVPNASEVEACRDLQHRRYLKATDYVGTTAVHRFWLNSFWPALKPCGLHPAHAPLIVDVGADAYWIRMMSNRKVLHGQCHAAHVRESPRPTRHTRTYQTASASAMERM